MLLKNKKIIFGGGIAGVILLGVLTNAIWDALKPLTAYLFKLTLNLSVLGVDKFKDNIYLEIAKGMHEGTSLQIFITVYSLLLGFIFATVLMVFLIRRKILLTEDVAKSLNFIDKIYNYQKKLPRKSWFVWFLLLYTLFTGTIFVLDLTKQKYINNAVTNFEQLSKIVRPYITEIDEEKFISNFSQIRNKKDYVLLMSKIESIAKDNNLNIPDFSLTF